MHILSKMRNSKTFPTTNVSVNPYNWGILTTALYTGTSKFRTLGTTSRHSPPLAATPAPLLLPTSDELQKSHLGLQPSSSSVESHCLLYIPNSD